MIPMRGVTACQEMERWKREKERELPGLFGPGLEERERELLPWLGRDEVGGGGDSCVLCSGLRCWLKDPDLRSAGTAWLYHFEHRGLICCGTAWQGPLEREGGGDRTVQAANQHNATPSGARGNWVHVPVLNEPLQRPQGWAQGSVREVVEAISVTVMSVCFLPSTSLLLCLICSVILHTVRLFTRTKMKWSVFSFTKTFCPT